MDRLTFSVGTSALGRIYWHEDNDAQQPFYALLDAKCVWNGETSG